jgi:hypothetical protein
MPRMDERRTELWDEPVAKLIERILTLEYEVTLLVGGARKPLCGDLWGGVSCQLFRGHEGLHAWGAACQDTLIRWG